jgi:hypothetical protein
VFESLVQSLLNNSIDHGPVDGTVVVRLTSAGRELSLEVENELAPWAPSQTGLGRSCAPAGRGERRSWLTNRWATGSSLQVFLCSCGASST